MRCKNSGDARLAAEILCDAPPRCEKTSDAMPRCRPLSPCLNVPKICLVNMSVRMACWAAMIEWRELEAQLRDFKAELAGLAGCTWEHGGRDAGMLMAISSWRRTAKQHYLSGPVLRESPRDYLSDTPLLHAMGFFGVSTWPIGCDTPSPFSARLPL